jgi:hypothetical protein
MKKQTWNVFLLMSFQNGKMGFFINKAKMRKLNSFYAWILTFFLDIIGMKRYSEWLKIDCNFHIIIIVCMLMTANCNNVSNFSISYLNFNLCSLYGNISHPNAQRHFYISILQPFYVPNRLIILIANDRELWFIL